MRRIRPASTSGASMQRDYEWRQRGLSECGLLHTDARFLEWEGTHSQFVKQCAELMDVWSSLEFGIAFNQLKGLFRRSVPRGCQNSSLVVSIRDATKRITFISMAKVVFMKIFVRLGYVVNDTTNFVSGSLW